MRYGELADLYTHGAPSAAFGALTDSQRLAGLEAASAELNGVLRARGPLPLTAWGTDVTQKICHVAAYELIARVGFNPAAGSDQNLLLRAQVARDWMKGIARGEVHPDVTYAVTPNVKAHPRVRSRANRGW